MAEESTLEGVIERLRAEGQLTRNSGTNSIKALIETNTNAFGLMSNRMGELIDFFKGNALQEEENRRELLKALKDGKKEEKKEDKKTKSDGFKIPGLSGILAVVSAGIIGILSGFVVGLGQNIVSVLKFLGKSLNKALLKPILNFIKRTRTFRKLRISLIRFTRSIKNVVGSIRGFLKNGKLITRFKKGLNGLVRIVRGFVGSISSFIKRTRTFRKLRISLIRFTRQLKSVSGFISNFVKNLNILKRLRVNVKLFRKEFVTAIKPVLNIFKAIPKAFGSIGGLINKVIPGGGGNLNKLFNPLKSFFSIFGKTLPIFFKLGKVLGKFFLPFTIITSLIDFVKGAFAGFEKYKDKGFLEGLIGGLLGGISGLATGLIGMPLDLLKSAVSWVAEKLGFENFSEMLDSFSFSELIGGLFTKVTDVIVGFITNIKDSIAEIGFVDTIKNIGLGLVKIFKKIASFPMAVAAGAAAALAAALPGGQTPMEAFKEGFAKVFNAGDATIDSFKVPTSGGVGSETGKESVENFEVAAKNTTGAEMEMGMSNISDAKSQGAPVIISGGSSPQSTVVNNTTTTYNGSDHMDESSILTRPLSTMAYGF
jgi:hypothetical protein